jgi:UrcA family protein
MKSLFKAASLAAGVAMALLAGAAPSAQADEIHIRVADLNLQSPEGAARFAARVEAAAKQLCDDRERLFERETCLAAVREEAKDNLAQQMAQLARRNGVAVAVASARP